jgi:hypothetical protein
LSSRPQATTASAKPSSTACREFDIPLCYGNNLYCCLLLLHSPQAAQCKGEGGLNTGLNTKTNKLALEHERERERGRDREKERDRKREREREIENASICKQVLVYVIVLLSGRAMHLFGKNASIHVKFQEFGQSFCCRRNSHEKAGARQARQPSADGHFITAQYQLRTVKPLFKHMWDYRA